MPAKKQPPKRKPISKEAKDRSLREWLIRDGCWNNELTPEENFEVLRKIMHWIDTGTVLGKADLKVHEGGKQAS